MIPTCSLLESRSLAPRARSWALSASYYPLRLMNQGRALAGLRSKGALRVVTYHDIAPHHEENFRAQLRWLARRWRFVTVDQFTEMMLERSKIVHRSVLLTFDDGFISNRRVADSVLHEMGISALFFVNTSFLGLDDSQPEWEFISERLWPGEDRAKLPLHWRSMGWDDLAHLLDRGHIIGAHTNSHPRLSDVRDHDRLVSEIVGSGDYLASRLNTRIDHFAFPFGNLASINPEAVAVAAQRYMLVYSGLRGDNAASGACWAIRRDAIRANEPMLNVSALLEGVCDRRYSRDAQELDNWGPAPGHEVETSVERAR